MNDPVIVAPPIPGLELLLKELTFRGGIKSPLRAIYKLRCLSYIYIYAMRKKQGEQMKAREFGVKLAKLTKKKYWLEKQRRTAAYYGKDGWRFKVEKDLRELEKEFKKITAIAPFVKP